jgi:hypothetical protein
MSAKPRSDSKLASLSPEIKAQLRTWLVDENKSYEDVRDLLYQDFNAKVGVGAVGRFYNSDCFALRSSEAKEFAEQVASELQTTGTSFDEATIALVKQKAFERAYARNGNLDELATLAKILGDSAKLELKRKDQQLTERRIVILETKAAQADAAKSITGDTKLSDSEKAAQMRALFGMG